MRTLELGGWQRIGIVVSIVWALSVGGVGVYQYLQVTGYLQTHEEHFYFADSRSIPVRTPYRGLGLYSLDEARGFRVEHEFRSDKVLGAIFVPIVLSWVLVYLCVLAARWVKVGFKR